MKTSCEHCIFKINTGKVQTGCSLDRLVKYDDAKLIDNHYEFEGYCNYCRNCYSYVAIAADPIAAVKKECELKYGVIYKYDGDSESLEKTIKSCNGGFEPHDFVICYDDKIEASISDLYEKFQPIFSKLYVTQSINDDMNLYNVFEMAMKKTKADFLYFCDIGEEIDKECVTHINTLINDEVKEVFMVVGDRFSIVYKKLFEKFAYFEAPMQKLYNSLAASEKYKDSIVKW